MLQTLSQFWHSASWRTVVPWRLALALAAALLVVLTGTVAVLHWSAGVPRATTLPDGAAPVSGTPAQDSGSLVRLPAEKARAAQLQLVEVARRQLQPERVVAGKIEYDGSRHLELSVPVACFVQKVLVAPGDRVSQGAPLAIMTSSEIGVARDEVRKHEADLELAKVKYEWDAEAADNVKSLLAALETRPDLAAVEEEFRDRHLCQYRETLLSAYSRLQFARQVMSNSAQLGESGIVSGRTMQQRRSDFEIAQASYQSACEEAVHDSTLVSGRARADVEHAARLLSVSREHLQSLLGPFGEQDNSGDVLNRFVIRAPMAARIEQRHIVSAAQVPAGQSLFTLADTSVLWVSAQIHERDWDALTAEQNQTVEAIVPALGDRKLTARIIFVGSEVSAETRSLPLVAELENGQQLLKPGMFVWVTVKVGQPREVLAIPASALMRHEQQAFVFVVEDERTFRRTDVVPGMGTAEWVEITSGLTAGQQIVDEGAFLLKSELLLEREDES